MEATREPRTVLVTGASGFIGACLCRHFAALGDRVVAVRGPSGRNWRLGPDTPLASSIETIALDLTAVDATREAIRTLKPNVVLNCAAYGAYPNQTDADTIYRVNFEAMRHLLDAASAQPGFRAFVQAGSSSEYGTNCAAPREDSAPRPDSDYAVSKVAASSFVQLAGIKRAVPAWVLRLSSAYGPYEDASRLVPKLLTRGRQGGFPPLVSPHISRDFVYVDDVCAAFEAVVERAGTLERGDIFNIGRGVCTTLEDIVGQVRKLFDIAEAPQWGSMANRRWDHRDWYSNPKKAHDLLGWRAATTLEAGLARTAQWMDENAALVDAAEANAVTGGK